MSTKSKDTQGKGFEPIAAGTYQAVCIGVIDIGTQPNFNPSYPARPKIIITWEIPDEKILIKQKDGSELECARVISATYTNTLASKGKLRPILESWRGKPFTDIELEDFELANLIAANCLLTIVHQEGTGKNANKVYANVASVSGLMKGMAKLISENNQVHFDLDTFLASGDSELPDDLHDWQKTKIRQSEEWVAAKNPQHEASEAEKANLSEVDQDVPF
jgi:hypothetical protein